MQKLLPGLGTFSSHTLLLPGASTWGVLADERTKFGVIALDEPKDSLLHFAVDREGVLHFQDGPDFTAAISGDTITLQSETCAMIIEPLVARYARQFVWTKFAENRQQAGSLQFQVEADGIQVRHYWEEAEGTDPLHLDVINMVGIKATLTERRELRLISKVRKRFRDLSPLASLHLLGLLRELDPEVVRAWATDGIPVGGDTACEYVVAGEVPTKLFDEYRAAGERLHRYLRQVRSVLPRLRDHQDAFRPQGDYLIHVAATRP